MESCLFCKIVKGEIPGYKVYEDELFLAFLDIFPESKGHTLVIPKSHHQWVYDVPQFGAYWEAVLKVTRAIQKGLQPAYISYQTSGLDVPHAHIHIKPRYELSENITPLSGKLPEEEMKMILKKITDNLS